MSGAMPAEATTLMLQQAELTDLRWVAVHYLREHRRSAYPDTCLCPMCRAAQRWIPKPEDDPFLQLAKNNV